MKVALCLYGLVGGSSGKNGEGQSLDPSFAANSYHKHLISQNEHVDVFIHSWSHGHRDELARLYNPVAAKIERQCSFDEDSRKPKRVEGIRGYSSNLYNYIFNREFYKAQCVEYMEKTFRAKSRWLSNKKVLELKLEHEVEYDFKYDAVIVSRLDMCLYSNFIFNDYDMNYFYASIWNHLPHTGVDPIKCRGVNAYKGYAFYDMWFFSNSLFMDRFAKLYDCMHLYNVNPHRASWQHVERNIGREFVRYTKNRWYDYELVRVRELGQLTADDLRQKKKLES